MFVQPNGTGKLTCPSGHTYEGVWSDGQLVGFAKHTLPSGAVFEGQFEDNVKNGSVSVKVANILTDLMDDPTSSFQPWNSQISPK